MKGKGKRLINLLLVTALLLNIVAMAPITFAAGNSAAEIIDLRVEDLVDPIGIDNPAPTFSWKMKSNEIGAAQTAYKILVTEKFSGKSMWDTGWVSSDNSVGIVYKGKPLSAATKYVVKVSIKDQKGSVTDSVQAEFETGLMSENAFDDSKWITYLPAADASDATNYTIDFDFIIDKGAMGIAFGMKNSANYLMWQVNISNGESQNKTLLRPHFRENGNWNGYSGASDTDVTAAVGTPNEAKGKLRHMRIVVNGKNIKTYLGVDADNLQMVLDYTHTTEVPLYNIGFRHDNEQARFDNIRVVDGNTHVIYDESFSTAPVLEGGNASGYAIKEGMLQFTHSNEQVYILRATGTDTGAKSLPAYRKSFTPKSGLVSAKLYTSGLGVYEAYINGQRVGNKKGNSVDYVELKPGYTDPGTRVFYSTFDITWMLTKGENVLSSVVSDGWWSGAIVSRHGAQTAFMAKLVLTYADGSKEVINTDTSWKHARAAKLQVGTGIYDGERFDNRVDESWMLPGFDDSAWENCVVSTEYSGKITAYSGVPVVVREDLERKAESITVYKGAVGATNDAYGKINVIGEYDAKDSITLNPGETLLVDFGQNIAGWEAFEVKAASGTTVHVEHGEILNDGNGAKSRGNDGPEGAIYNANYRSATADTYFIAAGTGEYEAYHTTHSFYGFRYIEITVDAPAVFRNITAQVVTSSLEDTGDIITSNSDINQLISNVRWGMYSNYLSIPTDCPQRDERQGWAADTQVFAITGSYLGFSKSFLEKFTIDMRDCQGADGMFPSIAPNGNPDGHFGWADAGVIVPYNLYMMYGDESIITENWEAMKAYLDGFLATNGGPNTFFGDWLAYESNDDQVKEILAVAFYAWDALMMSEMATAIGKTDEAARYMNLYKEQRTRFQNNFVKADGSLIRGEQTVCLYALYLDLLPNEESVAAVTWQLISNIEGHGNKLQTGFLGTAIILDTLTKIGRTDVAYKLLLQHDNPSWLYSVDQGATTIWERWNSYTLADGFGDVGMNSFNHYSYGAVAGWMFRYMAGIDFDKNNPGFKHILLNPRPDITLPKVNATYNSIYGEIVSSMAYEGNDWIYSATIPANTTATVTIPVMGEDSTILVNGKNLSSLTLENDGIVCKNQSAEAITLEAVACSFTVKCLDVTENENEGGASADQAAADAVAEKINAIGKVTKESVEKVTAARAAYDALSYAQRLLVKNYSVLIAAENALDELLNVIIQAENGVFAPADKKEVGSTGSGLYISGYDNMTATYTVPADFDAGTYRLSCWYVSAVSAQLEVKIGDKTLSKAWSYNGNWDWSRATNLVIGDIELQPGDTFTVHATGSNAWIQIDYFRLSLLDENGNPQLPDGSDDENDSNTPSKPDADIDKVAVKIEAETGEFTPADKKETGTSAQGNVWISGYNNMKASYKVPATLAAGKYRLDCWYVSAVSDKLIVESGNQKLDKTWQSNGEWDWLSASYLTLGELDLKPGDTLTVYTSGESAWVQIDYFRLIPLDENGNPLVPSEPDDGNVETGNKDDQKAADAVKDKIAAIGKVTKESAAAIEAARKAYDALSDAQKALVANYNILTAAEAELERLLSTIIQAEDGTFDPANKVEKGNTADGGTYISGFNAMTATYTVPADVVPGTYKLSCWYVSYVSSQLKVTCGDQKLSKTWTSNGDWDWSLASSFVIGELELKPGDTFTVRASGESPWIQIDYFMLTLVEAHGDTVDPTDPTDPSDPTDPTNPSDATNPSDPTNSNDPTNPSNPNEKPEPVVDTALIIGGVAVALTLVVAIVAFVVAKKKRR